MLATEESEHPVTDNFRPFACRDHELEPQEQLVVEPGLCGHRRRYRDFRGGYSAWIRPRSMQSHVTLPPSILRGAVRCRDEWASRAFEHQGVLACSPWTARRSTRRSPRSRGPRFGPPARWRPGGAAPRHSETARGEA